MTDTATAPVTSAAPDPNLAARILGIYFSPHDTFRAIVARPRWLGVMAITLVIGAACQYVIMSSPDLQEALLDQQIRAMNSRSGGASEQQIAGIERFVRLMPQIYAGTTLVLGPLFVAAIAGIFVGIFTTLMGGQGTFKQMFAVLACSGVISMWSGVFSAVLIASGVPPSGIRPPGANLAVFLPMLEEGSFLLGMLQTIDLFLIWWLIVLAIGVSVLYKRRPGGIATTLIAIYVVIAMIVGMASSS